uniref:Poly(ADP-ribose) polymerase family member 6 n=1 Tax=Xenopus tropicalis TaxID=8364 RepID=A0A803JSH1_XENTR
MDRLDPLAHPLLQWIISSNRSHIVKLPLSRTRCLQSRFLQSRNLNCIALCEVITSKDLQKHGNIWVCPVSDHVCTRFFFVYEDGQVGDANINTQDPKIQKEIMRVIGTQVYSG